MRSLPFLVLLFFCKLTHAQHTGTYTARFINILDMSGSAEASLEVFDDQSMTGSLTVSGTTKTLKGKAEPNGKFEVRSETVNNTTTFIKGTFSQDKGFKIELITETVEKGKGAKSKSSYSITGVLTKLPSVPKQVVQKASVTDNGQTQLVFEHDNPIFGKTWEAFPASAEIKTLSGHHNIEIEMKYKSTVAERRLHIRLISQTEEQKVWEGSGIAFCSYAESKTDAEGKNSINYFLVTASSPGAGQVELLSVSDTQVILKFNSLWAKRFGKEDGVTISGYIYATRRQ